MEEPIPQEDTSGSKQDADTLLVEPVSEKKENSQPPDEKRDDLLTGIKPAVTLEGRKDSYIEDAIRQANKVSEAVRDFKKRIQRYAASEKFYWPEDRCETESCILQLKEKQVLLIKGVASDWFNWAPQRIAAVLQTSLNRLWPGCDGVFRLKADEKLPFSFWKTFERFEKPVILVIPRASTSEYLRNSVLTDWEKAYYDFKEALKAINVFLIIQVPDDDENEEVFRQKESYTLLQELYAVWIVPVIKLELRRKKGSGGDLLYKRIKDEYDLLGGCDRQIYGIVVEDTSSSDQTIMNIIKEEINIKNTESELVKKALEEKTELKLVFIYCAAFFSDVTYSDFVKITGYLLKDLHEETRSEDGKLNDSKQLNEIWSRRIELRKLLSECMLDLKDMEGGKGIGFARRISHHIIRNLFLRKEYIFFQSYTEVLINQNVLFEENLSEKLYSSLVRVIAILIQEDYTTYDSNWLFGKAEEQARKLDDNIGDDQTRQLVEIGEKILDISLLKKSLEPLKGLFKELLLSGREELNNIVKAFFEKLISTRVKKNVALGLAIELYKELHDDGNFPEEELDRYLNRALNEGTPEDKFDVYKLIVKNIYYKDLYVKTSRWLADDTISSGSWTRKFAWLHKLDYLILSFHIHFRLNKSEQKYELLAGTMENNLNDSVRQLIKDLTSKECTEAWDVLLYDYLFIGKSILMETTVTAIPYPYLRGRDDEANMRVVTLTGDIFENWFYILYYENTTDESNNYSLKRMLAFVSLLKENVDVKKLDELESYWRRKIRHIYIDTILYYKQSQMDDEKKEEIIKKINNRSKSLEELLGICKANKMINYEQIQ